MRLNLTQHGERYQVRTIQGLTDCELFLDLSDGGAWPFLVGGVICLVDSDNERDLCLTIVASLVSGGFPPQRRGNAFARPGAGDVRECATAGRRWCDLGGTLGGVV